MHDSVLSSITVSIVSHGQSELVSSLLEDLCRCVSVAEVLVTENISSGEIVCPESLRSRLRLIRNVRPKGFASNHNQAFRQCETSLFAVLNPDIRLVSDPFPVLTQALVESGAGLIAPAVRNPQGEMEDSARYFPTPMRLFAKLLRLGDGRVPFNGQAPRAVDWTAGMFMLFKAEAFRHIGGFDEGFFLYYEDVDICARLWKAGHGVLLHPAVSVIHAAQRTSRRRPRYMAWHLSSMARYFCKHAWRLPRRRPDV